MAGPKNHHFVPQYYFRLFTGGAKHVCAYLTQHDRIVPRAPIRGQCARHKFYGNQAIESTFSHLEGEHASCLRVLIQASTTGDASAFSDADFVRLIQAIAFQRWRTELEAEKEFPAYESWLLAGFTEHLREEMPPDQFAEYLASVERGDVRITESPTSTVLRQISVALMCYPLLVDMELCLIRNYSDYPFVFSDSPVVFYNSYCKHVTHRGVLGLQAPGLQIFYPLTPTLQVMLIDAEVYSGRFLRGPFCEITERSDVSQLNLLQLHHSNAVVYMADDRHSQYVQTLYRAHSSRIVKPKTEFRPISSHDLPAVEALHIFEPQLNHDLTLSFVDCEPVSPNATTPKYRSPEVVEAHRRLYPEAYVEDD